MNIGQRLLRLVSPETEDMRRELRMTLAHAQATTEDLHRTVIVDGERIKKALEEARCKTPS